MNKSKNISLKTAKHIETPVINLNASVLLRKIKDAVTTSMTNLNLSMNIQEQSCELKDFRIPVLASCPRPPLTSLPWM